MAVEAKVNHQNITLQEKVRFLHRPDVYPEQTCLVKSRETHMSWVFLTDTVVYKMKKPVHYDFLDYRTVDARRYFCEEEVRLNRRLAEAVYLGTVALTVDNSGRLQLAGSGEAVDWLVKMKRLPHERMLDCSIKNRTVTEDDVKAVVNKLAGFYRSAEPVGITPDEYLARLRQRIGESRLELARAKYGLADGQLSRIHKAQFDLLANRPELFERRAAGAMIIEGHGDLRPDHIYLGPEPVIIDCLEFERDFRILDPVEELAFLAMECEALGAWEISRLIFEAYGETTGDRPAASLIDFYKSYRACLRAKISLWHIDDVSSDKAARWRDRAREYLSLAEEYTNRFC